MGIEDLRETVGLYRCDRCYKKANIEELIEDPMFPGILVHPSCADELGFLERKADDPRDSYQHYFKS